MYENTDLRLNTDLESYELRNSFVKAHKAVAIQEVYSKDKMLKVNANRDLEWFGQS